MPASPQLKHKWVVHLTTLLVMTLFVTLGVWQLGRGNFKMDVVESIDQQTEMVASSVQLPLHDPVQWRYKKIKLTGNYLSDKQFLLDNQVRNQVVGYQVLTPFFVKDKHAWVLVDRGWVKQGSAREQFPDINIEAENLATEEVVGSIYVPYAKPFSLGEIAQGEDSGWPRRIQFVDYQQLSDRLGVSLENFTLRLDPAQKHGYVRDWVSNQLPASKHYGYAFQWFAMATAVIVLWWVYFLRPLLRREEHRN